MVFVYHSDTWDLVGLAILLFVQLIVSLVAIWQLQNANDINRGLKWMFYGFISIACIITTLWLVAMSDWNKLHHPIVPGGLLSVLNIPLVLASLIWFVNTFCLHVLPPF